MALFMFGHLSLCSYCFEMLDHAVNRVIPIPIPLPRVIADDQAIRLQWGMYKKLSLVFWRPHVHPSLA